MKKVVLAALLAGLSLSASAAQTLRFATEASYPPFEFVDSMSIWPMRCVKRLMRPVLSLTRRLTA